jgi:LmbE family N-acetylglucosaminyl deacetylase
MSSETDLDNAFLRKFSPVLVVCPHTDDEFGCAGTICRLVEAGVEVNYIALSRCETSVPEHYPKDILEKECRNCTSLLGLRLDQVEVWDYPVRHFPAHRQEILERFVALKRTYAPNLVLLPASKDIHQDHAIVNTEGVRAFKQTSILGYELPQNLVSFDNTATFRLEEKHLEQKTRALASYQSQTFRPYAAADFIRSLARVRGVQCNAKFAEAFEVIRLAI